jgi:hypothetical protein
MSIKVLYRISDKSNPKNKIPNATKEKCLENAISVFGKENIAVFADNCEPETLAMIRSYGIDPSPTNLGNSGSWLHVVQFALDNFDDEQIVYLLEDDYFHLEGSANCLFEGLEIADYVTLYDHPDKYKLASQGGNPFVKDGGELSRVIHTTSTHWKTTNSTTMSFATRVKILKEDYGTWKRYTTKKIPRDFSAFKHLLGIGSIYHRVFGKNRKLVSPIPSLATHAEAHYLAPLVDWQKL